MLIHRELDRLTVDLGADLTVVRLCARDSRSGFIVCSDTRGRLPEGEPWPIGAPLAPELHVASDGTSLATFIPTGVRLALPEPPRAVLTAPLGRVPAGDIALVAVWAGRPPAGDPASLLDADRLGDLAARAQEYERVQRLEVATARSEAILAALEQSVVVLDDVRAVATVNPAGAVLLGLQAGERPVAEVAAALAALQARVRNGEAVREVRAGLVIDPGMDASGITWQVKGPDGDVERYLRVSTRPVVGSAVQGRVWVFDDITDEARAVRDAGEAEGRFRLLAENASDVVMSGTNEGIWEWISPSVERIVGWTPDEVIGTPFVDLLHPDDLAGAREAQARLGAGEPVLFDVRIRTKQGGYHWVSIAAKPVFDEAGAVVGRVGGWRDIAPQRELWDVMARALEGMPDAGILIFDVDMRFLVVRGGALRATVADRAWEGRLAREAVPPDQWAEVSAFYSAALRGESQDAEVMNPERTNTFLIRVRPLLSGTGDVMGGVVVVTDITERAAMERAVQQQNERLHDLDELKDHMIATVSHELRTPVTSLSLLLEVLADEDALPEPTRRLVEVGERSAARLRGLVEDLLLLAEADRDDGLRLAFDGVVPHQVVGDAAAELQGMAAERGVALRVDAHPVRGAEGDGLRLAQVVLNLVGNAIKFTPEGGEVLIRVAPSGDNAWVLGVHDTGIGIPAQDVARLFDPFFRASTATDAVIRGTGLGLAVVQHIVQGHGGTASVTSQEGHGTDITITFPLHPPRGGA